MRTRTISQLGYLGFEVSDMAGWEQFSTEVLGLAVSTGALPGTRLLRMDEHRYRFLLVEGPADDHAFAGWQVADVAAVEDFGRHLDAQGVAWSWANDDELALRMVQRMLHFKDPCGNRHEVYAGPMLALTRFASPQVPAGFVTGREGLGHVVYSSTDCAASVKFASQVLGLSPSDLIRVALGPGRNFEVTFMHANARHHSYAVAPNPPIPGPHKRLHHFMIETHSVEQVGFARDRCLAQNQGVLMDIGQHPNDRMISFYGQTPSGFYFEFGWGGAKVDEATWETVTYDKLSEWGHRPSAEVPLRKTSTPSTQEKTMSVSGVWNVVIKTPMGDNSVSFDLQAEGSELNGSIKGPNETNEIYDGSVAGNELKWMAKVSSPIPMTLTFNATIDGNTITGGAKSPFGTAPFSGSRAA